MRRRVLFSETAPTKFQTIGSASSRCGETRQLKYTYQKLIIPPRSQNRSDTPTLFVACMIVDGVEKIPVPTMRLTIKSDVEKNPSFLSVGPNHHQPQGLWYVDEEALYHTHLQE